MSTRTPLQRILQQQGPLPSPRPRFSRPLQHGRLFSNTSVTAAGVRKTKSQGMSQPMMKQPAQKSYDVMKKEQMQRIEQMPNDVGLIPGTFVMPTGPRLPSFIHNTKDRLRLEKFRFILRFKEIFGRYFIGQISIRPRPDYQTSRIPAIAKSLYEQMYTSFAAGTLHTMQPKLCENIYSSLANRIAARSPNTAMQWTLHRYISSPRTVSHKFLPMSVDDTKDKTRQTYIQQVVVRMHTLQSLKKVRRERGKDGRVAEVLEEGSSADPKEVTEYLVVQRLAKRGKLGDWMVWGTTTESGLSDTEA